MGVLREGRAVTETKEIKQEEVETAPVRTEFTKLDEDSERAYVQYVDRLQENVDEYVERLVEENRQRPSSLEITEALLPELRLIRRVRVRFS